MKKIKIQAGKCFAVFLFFMLICTIVSRGIYAHQMPKVTLGRMEERTLIHTIEANGTVVTREECPVVTESGLLIEKVCIVEGQKVTKGEVLFEIDENDLQKVLKEIDSDIQVKEEVLVSAEESVNRAVDRANQDLTDVTNSTNEKVAQADSEYQMAKDALAKCKKNAKAKKRKALEAAVAEKEQELKSIIENQEEALKQARRALEDAKGSTDDSLKLETQNQIELLKESQGILQKMLETNGKIISEIEGYVSSISIHAGERTMDTAALVIHDINGEKLFQAILSQEERAYVAMGDAMHLSFDNGRKQVNYVEINAVGELPDGSCQITGKVEDVQVEIGDSGKLNIQKDTGRYGCCIPLTALHTDNGTNYIFIVEEQETILGTELIAKKRKVKVLAKDEEYVALEENSVTEKEKLVFDADKEIKDGMRIRLVE